MQDYISNGLDEMQPALPLYLAQPLQGSERVVVSAELQQKAGVARTSIGSLHAAGTS